MNLMVSATKKIGRPATGTGTPVQVRMSNGLLTELDKWIAEQKPAPSRPEAVRRLLSQVLAEAESRRREKGEAR